MAKKIPDAELLVMASEFFVGFDPICNGRLFDPQKWPEGKNRQRIFVRNMRNPDPHQPDRWAILGCDNGVCLNKKGQWQYQTMPSNRDDEFYEMCRYKNAHEAIRYFRRWHKAVMKWAKEKLSKNPDAILNLDEINSSLLEF